MPDSRKFRERFLESLANRTADYVITGVLPGSVFLASSFPAFRDWATESTALPNWFLFGFCALLV